MPLELIFMIVVSVPFYVAITFLLGEKEENFDIDPEKPALKTAHPSTLGRMRALGNRSQSGIAPLKAIVENPQSFGPAAPALDVREAIKRADLTLGQETAADALLLKEPEVEATLATDPVIAALLPSKRCIDAVLPAGPARLSDFDPDTDALVVLYAGFLAPTPCEQTLCETGLTITFSDGARVILDEVTRTLGPADFVYQSSMARPQRDFTPAG